MSGPQDPRQWQPQGENHSSDATQAGSPWQQQPSQDATWHAPAYTPTEYPQYQQPEQAYQQQYPAAPGYGQQSDFGSQATQYGATPQYGQYGQPQQPAQYGQPQQYGQPGQPGQYGQPAQPGQPAQYPGQYGPQASGPKRSKGLMFGLIGGGVGLLVVVILILGFWQPGFFVTTKLDINKANAGVQQILSDETNGYGAKNVKDVKCNNGTDPTVKKGSTFDCTVSIDGASKHVTVTFQDENGTYEVGRPQ